MKKILAIVAAVAAFALASPAQSISLNTVTALLKDGIIKVGTPFSVNGVTALVTTNDAGNYVISVTGPAGTITSTPPTTVSGAVTTFGQYVAANNKANANFYGTNEIVGRVGAVYLQNSGQAVVEVGAEKYGLLKSMPQIGAGVAIFQGNRSGYSGTAGGVAFVDYRRIIGDVSFQVGLGGGYDNWTTSAMGVVKADVELRQNAHLGEYVGVGYAVEKGTFGAATRASDKGGLMVRGGVNYAF